MSESRQYYTYVLINSLSNKVFYVGKGKYQRMYNHEYSAQRGLPSPLYDLIRAIWQQGGHVICVRLADTPVFEAWGGSKSSFLGAWA